MRSRLGLLRQPDFFKLWTASTISLFGTQVSQIAIPVIAVLILHVSPFEVAMLGTLEFLPFLLFTLPAGVWVDLWPRRLILVGGDLGRAVMLATIPIAFAVGGLTIWQLYIVGFVNGILTVFFDVADQSYLPTVLEREELTEGNSKLQVSQSSAQILGQPVGGGIVALLSAPFAVIVDALSYLGSAALIVRIQRKEAVQRTAGEGGRSAVERPGIRSEIAEGLRYVLGHKYLRNIAACTGSSNLCSNIVFAVFPIYVYVDLQLSPAQVGAIGGVGGAGVLVGALIANRIAATIGVGRTILYSAALFGPFNLLIPLATKELALPFIAAAVFTGGMGSVIYNVNQVSLRQAITPERMLGRMNATMRFLVWGTIPIGSIIGGTLATVLGADGVHLTIWIGTILGFGAFLPILFSPVPALQTIPTLEPEMAASGSGAGLVGTDAAALAGSALSDSGTDELTHVGEEPPVYERR
jgi:MFS family permease